MKTLVSFRYSNEDIKSLEPVLSTVINSLEEKGIDAYCTFFHKDLNNSLLTPKDWMRHAFSIINNVDFLFVVQHSNNKSEGMLMEVGYSLAKHIPIVVAARHGIVDSYLSEMTEHNMQWKSLDDLNKNLSDFNFNDLKKRTEKDNDV